MYQTATNPETGEKVALIGGRWVPITQTASNPETGERVGLAGNQWVPVGRVEAPTPADDPVARDRQESAARIRQIQGEIAKREEMQKSRLPGGSAQAATLAESNEKAAEDIDTLQRRLDYIEKTGQLPPDPTVGSVVSDLLRGAPRMAAAAPGQIVGGLAGLLGSGLTAAGAEETGGAISRFGGEAERGGQQFAENLFGGRSEAAQFSPGAAFAAEASEAVGSVAPYLATEGLAGLGGLATKGGRAAIAAGQVPTATRVIRGANYPIAAGQGAGEAGQRVEAFREEGGEVTPTQEFFARLGGAGLGLTEIGVVNRMIERVPVSARREALSRVMDVTERATAGRVAPRATLQAIDRTLAVVESRAVGRIGLSAAEEAGQEGLSTFGQNLLAQQIYNPEQELSEDVLKSMALGSIAGGTVRGGAEAVQKVFSGRQPADQEAPPVAPKVRAEFRKLVAQQVFATMRANPDISQDEATNMVVARADVILEQARANVEAAQAQTEAGAGLDGGAGQPDVDVAGAAGAGVPPAGAPTPTGEATQTVPQTEPVGVASTGEPAGVATGAETGADSALTGEYNPDLIPAYLAETSKAKMDYVKPVVMDIFARVSGLDISNLKALPEPAVKALNISIQQVHNATKGKQPKAIDPEAVVREQLAAFNIPLPKAVVAGETPGTFRTTVNLNGEERSIEGVVPRPAPTMGVPSVTKTPTPTPTQTVEDEEDILAPARGEMKLAERKNTVRPLVSLFADDAIQGVKIPTGFGSADLDAVKKQATNQVANQLAKGQDVDAAVVVDTLLRNRGFAIPERATPAPTQAAPMQAAPTGPFDPSYDYIRNRPFSTTSEPEPEYTPQQIAENLTYFSRSEAESRGYEPNTVPYGMFTEGARDVARGAEPMADEDILAMSGQEGLGPYKAGLQWAQGSVAAAQAPAAKAAPKKAAPKKAKAAPKGPVFENIAQPNTPEAAALVEEPRNTDIAALAEELPEADRVNVRARLDRITENYAKDGDVERLLGSLEELRKDVDRRIARNQAKQARPRVRGFERAMEVIYRAERTGQLSPQSAALVRWLLERNPAIAEELAFSFQTGNEQSPAGQYNPIARLITIFASGANDGTATHEVLHHAERLMPEAVRNGIRAAWRKRVDDLIAIAERTNNTEMRNVLGAIVQAYYGDPDAQRALSEAFAAGNIPYSVYHLSNPSEFWAVNATDLIGKRAERTGWLGAARTWLSDFIETVKDLFGLPNDAAIITGLRAVLAAESGTIQGQMLASATSEFLAYAGESAMYANTSKLLEAQALEAAGAVSSPAGTTRAKTGWFRGVDNKWRFEVDDLPMRFKQGHEPLDLEEGREYRLGDVIDHPELFKQYPALEDIKVQVLDTEGAGGYWDWRSNLIAISKDTPKNDNYYLDILIHEIQHAIQLWEGFADGAAFSENSYPVSLGAINKALDFLKKYSREYLFLWDRMYHGDDLKDMQFALENARDAYGADLDKANEIIATYKERIDQLNTESMKRKFQAKTDWRNGNHPEAVKYRALTNARIELGRQLNDFSIQRTPEERAALDEQFRVASEAESAQYKYNEGLIATGVVPKPDITDLIEQKAKLGEEYTKAYLTRRKANILLSERGADKLMYYLTAGEVEARDAAKRRSMSEAEQEQTPPYVTDRFSDLQNMIVVDAFTGASSAPPVNNSTVNKVAAAKLTKVQIKKLEEAAGIRRMKITGMQKRILRSRSAEETTSLMGKLMLIARNPSENGNILTSLFNSVSGPSALQKLLGPQLTEDVVRLANAFGLKNVQRIDDLMRNEYIPYVNRMVLSASQTSEKLADFLSRTELGAKALTDVVIYANMVDVDPSLAPNATEYFKLDNKLAELKAELASETDPKKRKAIQNNISTRQGEISRAYTGGVDEQTEETVYGWNDLSRPEFGGGAGKLMFRMLRDEYRKTFDEHYRLLMARINAADLKSEDRIKLKSAVEKMFAEAKKRTIYFPLKRFGEYWVTVGKGKTGEFHMFESLTAQEAFMAQLRESKDIRNYSSGFGRDTLRKELTKNDASAALKNILDLIADGKAADVDVLEESVLQLYLTALPESDMRRRFIHRSFKTGFSTDLLRTYASTSIASANQLGRLAFNYKFDNLITAGLKETEGRPSKAKLDTITREMALRVKGMLSPNPQNDVDWYLSLGSKATFYLLLSAPKSAVVNLLQLPVVGLPTLSAEFGEAATTATMARYMGTFLTGKRIGNPFKDKDGNLKLQTPKFTLENSPYIRELRKTDPARYGELMKAWRFFEERDVTQSTFTASANIYERSNKPSDKFSFMQSLRRGDTASAAQLAVANTGQLLGASFHTFERIGREIMVMSAFDMAYERAIKQGKTPKDAGKEARELAEKLTSKAMFDFSNWNKSRYAKSRAGRLPLQMRSYSQSMTSLLLRSLVGMLPLLNKEGKLAAARMFFGVAAMTTLLGGLRASWLYMWALGAYGIYEFVKEVFGDDDDEEEKEIEGGYVSEETIQREMLKFADGKGRELSKKDMEYFIRSVWIPETFGSGGTMQKALNLSDEAAAKLAAMADMGLPALGGVDISSSVSLNDLWHSTPAKSDDPEVMFLETLGRTILGPSAALVAVPFRIAKEANAGNMDKAVEAAMPAALKNVFKAARLEEEGLVVGKNRDVVLKDPSFYDVYTLAMQSLGFTEAGTSRAMQLDIKAGEIEEEVGKQATELLDQRYRAVLEFNKKPTDENLKNWKRVERDITVYNLNYPSNIITEEDKDKSFQSKSKVAGERAYGLGFNPKIPVRQPLAEQRANEMLRDK